MCFALLCLSFCYCWFVYFSYDRNILNNSSTDEMNRLCLLLCFALVCLCLLLFYYVFRRKMLHYKLLTHGKGDLGGNEVE